MAATLTVPSSRFDEFDLGAWPRVTIRFPRAPHCDEEIEQFQNRMCGLLAVALEGSAHIPKGPVSVTFFIDGVVEADLGQQLKAAQTIALVAPMVERGAIKATAIVVSSQKAHDLLKFILSIAPLKSVNRVFEDGAGAAAWLDSL